MGLKEQVKESLSKLSAEERKALYEQLEEEEDNPFREKISDLETKLIESGKVKEVKIEKAFNPFEFFKKEGE